MALDFAREAKYGDAADIIRSQQRFIAAMHLPGGPVRTSPVALQRETSSAMEAAMLPLMPNQAPITS
jgi:hypothetical protein